MRVLYDCNGARRFILYYGYAVGKAVKICLHR